ncbi:ThuA domain-containing protein [Emticicia sp. BO119]|uniref:ThuA domain-containing protein n=1 Tax=Emticicia sp. BO119 TaxID=2757768 RepID=UPI0015F08E46|nr:ThuA domain-containing protein [Emticicia sp. BO119]MBA4849641.1 ThuA domain-containing protein [Emticicia sp. BO119]
MNRLLKLYCLFSLSGAVLITLLSAHHKPKFKALVVASRAKDHLKMIAAAKPFFEKMAAENNFNLEFTDDTSLVNEVNLMQYKVFIQLHLAPFDMSQAQQAALQQYIENGGGWVGIHAAGLTGAMFKSPKREYWQWFEDFMGGIEYSPHPKFQKGTFIVEDRKHPATNHLPKRIEVADEWYEFNKSPRANVRVLASANESTYTQNKPMGDHPLIWCNEKYPHTIYIGIGHDASLCNNKNYTTLVRNAILWAGSNH